MTSNRKNILVGLTVLGALAVLGWMIVQFGGQLGMLTGGRTYAVRMVAPRANGLSEGAQVLYLGTPVGRVHAIRLNETRTGFNVELRIDQDSNLPANVVASIRSINPISGASAVALEPAGPTADGALRDVAGDNGFLITAQVGATSIVPDEFSAAADEIRLAVAELRSSGLIDNLNRQVSEVGRLAGAVEDLVGDERLRGDVKATVASVREAAASAERIGRQMEEFATRLEAMQDDAAATLADARDTAAQVKQTAQRADEAVAGAAEDMDAIGQDIREINRELLGRLQQMSATLANVEDITSKINQGHGTAGKLVNDDRLYELLVANMQLLEETVRTSNRLLSQWEQEGIRLRLFR